MRFLPVLAFCAVVWAGMFSDILKGLFDSKSPRLTSFVEGLPNGVVDALENNEQEAGEFFCQVLEGNVPGVIAGLADDVWDEIKDDWSAVTGFIESIPELAPAVLEDIIDDGEDVVSVIGELFVNPEAAVTAIVNGVESVIGDIASVGGEIVSGIVCLFDDKKCQQSSAANPAATISASCQAILGAAPTAAPTTYGQPASAANSYPLPQASASQSPVIKTSAPVAASSDSITTTTKTPSPTSTKLAAATTQSSVKNGAPDSLGSTLLEAWLGIFVCFLVAVAAL